VYRNGLPIREIKLKSIDAGISFEEVPGIVPLFHEISACKAAHYTFFGDWQDLSGPERSTLIAHYYLQHMLDQNIQDAQTKYQERQMRKSRKK